MPRSQTYPNTFISPMPAKQGVIQQCSTFNVTTTATNFAANETFSSSSSGSFTNNVTGGMPTSIISSTSGVLNVDIDAPFRPATDILVPVTAGHKYSIDSNLPGISHSIIIFNKSSFLIQSISIFFLDNRKNTKKGSIRNKLIIKYMDINKNIILSDSLFKPSLFLTISGKKMKTKEKYFNYTLINNIKTNKI